MRKSAPNHLIGAFQGARLAATVGLFAAFAFTYLLAYSQYGPQLEALSLGVQSQGTNPNPAAQAIFITSPAVWWWFLLVTIDNFCRYGGVLITFLGGVVGFYTSKKLHKISLSGQEAV